jgi:hypothetical protein
MSDPASVHGGGDDDSSRRNVFVSLERIEHLERCEVEAALNAKKSELLQTQVDELDAALKAEQARGEKFSEAFMLLARSGDARVSELKEHHAAALRAKELVVAKLEHDNAAKDATVMELKAKIVSLTSSLAAAIAKLETQGAAPAVVQSPQGEKIFTRASTLHANLREVLKIVFDKDIYRSKMAEQKIDVKRMPLGSLTNARVERGNVGRD